MNVDPLRLVTPEERVVAISLLRRAAEKGRLSDAELQRRLEGFFTDHVDPQYDLYQGGGSKSGLRTQKSPPLRPKPSAS